MNSRYAFIVLMPLLAIFGCAPEAPVSTPPVPDSESKTISDRVPRMTIGELLKKIESNADILIVDTRADVETEFASGHIKGAIPVPLTDIIAGQWTPPADKEIIFYCT